MKKSLIFIERTMLFSFLLLLMSLPVLTVRAAGEIDPTFNAAAQSTTTGSVRTIVSQPDGKLLVGGQFAVAGNAARNGIVRLNADGTVDTSFNPPEFSVFYAESPSSFDNVIIYAVAVQSDGKILVGGSFDRVNGQDKLSLVRLNANGSLDSTFADFATPSSGPPTSSPIVFDIKIQSDNRIVVGSSQGIARLNFDGSRDASLQSSNIGEVYSLIVQPDGKIIVGNTGRDTVYRISNDGTTDNTFFPASYSNIFKLAMQSDGKILVGDGTGIRRLNANGSPDATFNPGGSGPNGRVLGIAPLPDGKILIGGFFTTYNGVTRFRAARLNNDGTLDQSFNYVPTSTMLVYTVAVTNDGKAIVGGIDPNPNGSNLSRLNSDGSVDTAFVGRVYGRGIVYKILSQPDGKVLVAGAFNKINGVIRRVIARLNADGSVDTGFTPPSFSGVGLTAALQSDGKVLFSKDTTSSSPGDERTVVRLNSDGSVDTSFQPLQLSGGRVTEIAVQSDGRIIVGGYFSITGSTGTFVNLARLNADGSEDTTFTRSVTSVNNNGSGLILALKVQPNGKIVIGGRFTRVGTAVRNNIARFNADGTLDETFNQPFGVNSDVYDLALQSNGNVIIGGIFTQVNATANFRYIARLLPDASLDTSFNPQPDGAVHSLETQPDDKIIIGGLFNSIGGAARTNLARLNAGGTIDGSFNATANEITFSINIRSDGKILIGGRFTRVNGVSSIGIARLLNAVAPTRTPFDFDGDGRADVAVFRPSTGYWYTSQNPAINYGAVLFGQNGDKTVPADYDGDGKTDVAVFRNGNWYIQRSTLGFIATQFGDSNDVLVPADYDGDGRADIAVFRPSNGTWYLLQSSAGFAAIAFGAGTDKPVPGDYNGDGKVEVAVFRPSNGYWYLTTNPATNYGGVLFGQAEDKPVPADYDGDGKTDLAVFRPSNGSWYLLQSTAGFAGVAFGLGTDKPVPADYDGDGRADVAVFRDGNWYLNRSTQGFTGIQFGTSTDLPAPNSFVR